MSLAHLSYAIAPWIGLALPGTALGAEADLQVKPAQDLHIAYTVSDPAPADLLYSVRNDGEAGTVLAFAVVSEPNQSWLQFAPAFGVVPGQTEQSVALQFVPKGLPKGAYECTLRFVNVADPSDSVAIKVTLDVSHLRFAAGDRLVGDADPFLVEHPIRIDFDAVKGMKLGLEFPPAELKMHLLLRVLDPEGDEVKALDVKLKTKGKVLEHVKLESSGEHTLVIQALLPGPIGAFEIKTSRSLPALAKDRKLTLKSKPTVIAPGPTPFDPPIEILAKSFSLEALPGATLGLTLQHLGASVEPLSILWILPPDHQKQSASAFYGSLASGGAAYEGVPLDQVGGHSILVQGFAAENDLVKAKVTLKQPPPGTATVILPSFF